jgi:hypothetical protein
VDVAIKVYFVYFNEIAVPPCKKTNPVCDMATFAYMIKPESLFNLKNKPRSIVSFKYYKIFLKSFQ